MNSPMQPALFYERIEQALDAVVTACGGRKTFACEMWPDKLARDAHNLMDACLNPDRREKFAPHQLLYILQRGHEAGAHAAMQYIAVETGYRVEAISPEAERDRLADAILEGARTLDRALRAAERIPPKVRAA